MRDAVDAFLPWYSSVHRGSGLKSQVATEAFEGTREVVRAFVGGRAGDDVVFVRNTTEAINVLAAALPPGTRVLATAVEHHANLLPWRRHRLRLLPCAASPTSCCDAAERALRARAPPDRARRGHRRVERHRRGVAARASSPRSRTATARGCSSTPPSSRRTARSTWPRPASTCSPCPGHKLYAPFGAGALVGDLGALGDGAPLLRGGGAIKLVTEDDVIWADGPERHEAGSPNVVGVVALARGVPRAARARDGRGRGARARAAARLAAGLAGVPGPDDAAAVAGGQRRPRRRRTRSRSPAPRIRCAAAS